MWKFGLWVLLLLPLIGADNVLHKFIRDYYAAADIHQIIVFTCYNIGDAVKFSKSLMQLDTSISLNLIPLHTALEDLLKVNYYNLGIILDLDCAGSDSVLQEFSEKLAFNETYVWLLLTSVSVLPIERLKQLPLAVNTELTIACRKNDEFTLYDVYNPSYRHNGQLNITYKGHWNAVTKLVNQLTQYKYVRRGNFNLLPLNFSVILHYPPLPDLYTYLSVPINQQFDGWHRYHWGIVLQLRDTFNFSINLHRAQTWGYLYNGTFSGMVGDMVKKLIDISASPFQYKAERLAAVHYTVETLLLPGGWMFRHPRESSLKNNFLKPFTNQIWYMVMIVGITYWIFLLITVKVQMHCNALYLIQTEENTLVTIPASETALTAVAAISQQGLNDGPQIIAGRIVFLSLFLWSLLLYQFYSANILASILTPTPHSITTIKNLTDSNLDIGCEDAAWMQNFFNITNDPAAIEIYKRKVQPTSQRPRGSYFNITEGFSRVRKGGFAFYAEGLTAYKMIADTFTEDEMCDLVKIRMIPYTKIALVTAKHSPFTKMVIYGLRRIVQHGLHLRMQSLWFPARPKCPESHSSKPSPVEMKQFLPAIFLLLMGVGGALSVLAVEYIHYYKNNETLQLVDDDISSDGVSEKWIIKRIRNFCSLNLRT